MSGGSDARRGGGGGESVVPLRRLESADGARALLRLGLSDTVAVALRPLVAGETLDADGTTLGVSDAVPKGHKIALVPVERGGRVLKYGQTIGYASAPIAAGCHVHTHNLEFRASEAVHEVGAGLVALPPAPSDHFDGYRRADGRVGTRNFVAVISSVNCSATVARRIADAFDEEALGRFANVDGVAAFTHGTGCGMDAAGEGYAALRRVIGGYAAHPNVAAVLVVGLGCETSQIGPLLEAEGLERGPLLVTMNIQGTGGTRATVEHGRARVLEMLPEADRARRERTPAAELALALQCGGSDAWSGITANPALGHAADLLVAQGGTAVLAETPEIYGAEHLLTRRATRPEVAEALLERIRWWEGYVARHAGSLDNNPSPGNKLGGLTTILEKSLGAVAKGGTAPLEGVLAYAERIGRRGFHFMDSPGYDPASVTGQIASGCNLVAFTTGRGSAFGSKPAPCLKIATNSEMYRALEEDMDIDAGSVISGTDSVEAVGRRIYRRLLALASGERSKSERQGLGDNEFVPWQIGAVM